MNTSTHTLARRAPILAAAASLLLTPCLFAQTPAPAAKDATVTAAPAAGLGKDTAAENEARLYTIEFKGGNMLDFSYVLRENFPKDNFVIDDSDRRLRMPPFELRNVRLAEIGRTVEFLTRGDYKVEIVDGPAGNIWRIGPVNKSTQAAAVKMRSVAAPSLFSSEKALAEIQQAAEMMDRMRLEMIDGAGGNLRRTTMEPLASQKIFVIIGDEDGVAGMESIIKAAEQRLSNEVAAKTAAFTADAPKIRAVLAPHIFAEEARRKQVVAGLREVETTLREMHDVIKKISGSENVPAPWADARPQPEQKIFVLRGTEAGIAGMESLIRAAEQLAAEEGEKMAAEMRALRAKDEEKKARAEAELKAAEEAAKEKKGAK